MNLDFIKNKNDLSSFFRISFFISAFFGSITYLDKVTPIFIFILFSLGLYIIYDKFKTKALNKIPFYKIILYFIATLSLSSIINCVYGFTNAIINIITILTAGILFIDFFGISSENKDNAKKELFLISKVILYLTVIINVLGFIMLFIFQKDIFFLGRRLIIYENRFIGFYSNPNLLSFSSVVSNLCCLILLFCKNFFYSSFSIKKYPKKSLIITGLILNSICIFLSDSNAGILFTSCFIIGLVCYKLFSNSRFDLSKKVLLKALSLVVVSFIIPLSLLGIRIAVNSSMGYILSATPELVINELIPTEDENQGFLNSDSDVSFDHLNSKVDSGRIKLIKKAFEYIKQKPLLGWGKGKPIIDSYNNGKYIDFHNGYLTIFVTSGLVGFSLFLSFGILFGCKSIFSLFCITKKSFSVPLVYIFAFICAYCVFSMVEKTLLFDTSFMIISFWYLLGIFGSFVDINSENKSL